MMSLAFPRNFPTARRTLASLFAATLLAGMFTGCAAQYTPDTPVIPLADLQAVRLQTKWVHQVPLATFEKPRKLWLVGPDVEVLTSHNYLHGYSAASGTTSYTLDLGEQVHKPYTPIILGPSILGVTDANGINLYNTSSNQFVQHAAFDFSAGTRPVSDGKYLLMGSSYQDFVCTFAEFEGLRLNTYEHSPFTIGKRKWVITSPGDSFIAAPVLLNPTNLFIASQKGHLWSVDVETGTQLWMNRQVNGQVVADVAADQGRIFIPCLNHHLYAFESLSGTHLWDTFLEGKLDQTPLLTDTLVLQPSTGKGLYALAIEDGLIKWFNPTAKEVVAVIKNKVLALDEKKNLILLNLQTGNIEKSLVVPNAFKYLYHNQTLYILTKDGRLAAVEAAKD